ncbi:hypothetical protein OIU78_011691 [Salix suchowensis]|nr:hypothetical protein OIU78_011691 [Salix suchowensis]
MGGCRREDKVGILVFKIRNTDQRFISSYLPVNRVEIKRISTFLYLTLTNNGRTNGIIRDLNTSNHEINRSFCCSFFLHPMISFCPSSFKNQFNVQETKPGNFLPEKRGK